jgi:hypothetical protein
MFAEITKIEIGQEIDGFERSVFQRLLPAFDNIQQEAKQRANNYKNQKSKNFNPGYDVEGNIEDHALSIELYYSELETRLHQNFLNSCAVELRHIFEKRLKILFNTAKHDGVGSNVNSNIYDIDQCPDWKLLNNELRIAANAIKHGGASPAFAELKTNFPHLIISNEVHITESNLKSYLQAMRNFWSQTLAGRIIC